MSKEKIQEVLSSMDTLDEEQWTADGSPKVDYVRREAGDDSISRHNIFEAAPSFSRENPVITPVGKETEETEETEETDAPEEPSVPEEPEEPEEPEVQEDDSDDKDEEVDTYMSRAEFVRHLAEVPKEDLQALEDTLKERRNEISLEIDRLKDLFDRAGHAVQLTRARRLREIPEMTDQEARQLFIKKQNEQRMARFAKLEKSAKSPLDQAMSRKNPRGQNRPARTIQK